MIRDIPISKKRGCDRDSLNLILVKANVNYWLSELEEHKFCSSIRQATAEKIKRDLDTKRNYLRDRGFLDTCLKYHHAYLPTDEDIPSSDRNLKNDFPIQKWNNSIEQMDIIMRSNYWSYYDRDIPQKVIKIE